MALLTNHRPMMAKSARFLFLLSAIIGFLYQAYQISDEYFKYQTRTQVYITIPEKAVFHNLAICIAFNDLLDGKRLNQDAGINLTQPQTFIETTEQAVPVTVKQVFDYTPGVGEIFEWCIIRKDDWLLNISRLKECDEYFSVTKYMTQEFICYNIKPAATLPVVDLRHVTQSQYLSFIVYNVEFGALLRPTHLLNTISYIGDYPFTSRDFSAFTLIAGDSAATNVTTINVFDVFSADVTVKQLPAPHDTMCRPIASNRQHTCKYECLKHRFRYEKKIHPNVIITEPIDYKIISHIDLIDENIKSMVSKHDRDCHRKCFFNPCVMSYTKTSVSTQFDAAVVLAFSIRSPTEPDILSQSEPVMTFVEYFSLMCSCLSTWFGICFLSLDPFQYQAVKKYLDKTPAPRTKVVMNAWYKRTRRDRWY